ncbi:MAG: citramalate synthase, partial [Chloroflexi bacterium]|nr:citramalate synthase [Chloroflexota bacterium]
MNYKVELYDTTLRDGTQQEGISLSVEDKLAITERLDQLGIDVIEGGFAGANPKDDEYFRRVQSLDLKHAQIAAFGNTRRANGDAASDLTLKALLDTNAPVLTLVGKSSEYQVRVVLQTSLEENLAMIADSVRYLKARDRRVFFDAEHFFDGYKLDRDYALQTLRVALDAGADRIVLCDTNGGTLPAEIARIVSEVKG